MNSVVNKKEFLGVSKMLWRDPRTWLLLLAITEKNIFRYMMLVVTMATGAVEIGVIILHTAYIILIAKCIQKGSRFYLGDWFVLFFVIFSIILTWIIFPANIENYMFGKEQFWPTVFPLFRFFIVGLFFIPNKETVDLMGKVSCLAVFVESLFVLIILRGSELQNSDDMSRSYFILLNVLLVVNYAYDSKSKIAILFSVIGTMFLVSMGTRGPVVIVLAFLASKIFQTYSKKGHGTIVIIVALLLIWFVNSGYWNEFLLILRDVLSSLGLSTRVIDLTIQGETLTYYSERDEIAHVVMNKIKERPEGWGVYGEWQFVGWSAHNMYLEILDNYGVIIGGVIILWMLYINIKAFLTTNVTPVRGLVLLFACNVLVRGVYGGGFLTFPTFLMIGYCLQVCRKTNFRYL